MTLYMSKTVVLAGDVKALVRFHMNGLIPSERTVEQITKTMSLDLKQYQVLTMKRITIKITRVATLLVLARL